MDELKHDVREVTEMTAGAGLNPAPAVISVTSRTSCITGFILFSEKFGTTHKVTIIICQRALFLPLLNTSLSLFFLQLIRYFSFPCVFLSRAFCVVAVLLDRAGLLDK